jgi:predicted permease
MDAGLGKAQAKSSPQLTGTELYELPDSVADQQGQKQNEKSSPLFLWVKFAGRREVWTKILTKIVYNPIMWGITVGFILSLSTLGPSYLRPTSPDYVEGLGWIWSTTGWLGDCVSPVSLFAMGVWMQDQGKKMFQISPRDAFLFMLSKLVLVPLLVLGLAEAFDLDSEPGRAAVLIAALPISMASFSLGSKYEVGESILAANVCLGTLLMLPTVLVWNLVMDSVDIFTI